MPHCHNISKTKYTTLSQQLQNQIYHTVTTVPKPNIPHCRNSSKTKYTTLSQQFQSQIYHTVTTVPKPNIKIVERGKIDTPTYEYMTPHFPVLVQTPRYKVARLIKINTRNFSSNMKKIIIVSKTAYIHKNDPKYKNIIFTKHEV